MLLVYLFNVVISCGLINIHCSCYLSWYYFYYCYFFFLSASTWIFLSWQYIKHNEYSVLLQTNEYLFVLFCKLMNMRCLFFLMIKRTIEMVIKTVYFLFHYFFFKVTFVYFFRVVLVFFSFFFLSVFENCCKHIGTCI